MSVSPSALDPELSAALAALPRGANGSLMDLTDIPALRTALAAGAALLPASDPDPGIAIETVRLPRPDGTLLDVVLFRPAPSQPRPALVWFHAGGQVVGSAHDDRDWHTALALALDCVVVAVDYRLAPETPAPGAAEDGYLAYTSLVERAEELGLIADRIGLAGASGGGAPAAATTLMIRDRGAAMPRVLSLSYAMLDDRIETASSREVTDVGIWDRRENLLAWAAVLGDRAGGPSVDAYSAPGRARDLSGMPETFVAAAQFDVFRDEDVDFAARLIAAGVSVDLHVYAHAFHAWDRFAPASALTRSFEATWHDYLRRRLHG